MQFDYYVLIGYLMVASFSASFGFLFGTLLQSGKVSELYSRLDVANALLREHASKLLELERAMGLPIAHANGVGHSEARRGTSVFPQSQSSHDERPSIKVRQSRRVEASTASKSSKSS